MQFDSFVDFAQKSMTAGCSKAVARADIVVPGVDGGFATRTIVAAPDEAFKLSRSITDKAKNDTDTSRHTTAANLVPDAFKFTGTVTMAPHLHLVEA